MLNQYHKFSFKAPPKNRDFTPAQKSAIRRQFNKLANIIIQQKNDAATFIPNQKVKGGIQTNKGTFFNYPNATVKKAPKKSKLKQALDNYKIKLVQTVFGVRREIFLPFPKSVAQSMDKIEGFVNDFKKLLKPTYIRWSTSGQMTSEVYDPGTYTLYSAELFIKASDVDADEYENEPFFNGVFFGYEPKGV